MKLFDPRLVAFAALFTVLTGAQGEGQGCVVYVQDDDDDSAACEPEACGPQPELALYCEDGSLASMSCVDTEDGCRWQFDDCSDPCRDGYCGGECFTDEDCGAGYTCEGEQVCPENAYCFAPDVPGTCVYTGSGCSSDFDCAEGYYCAYYSYYGYDSNEEPADAPVQAYGECLPLERWYCASDADCGEGYYCAYFDYAYGYDGNGSGDSAGMPAPGGECAPIEGTYCGSDIDCGPGYVCELYCPDGSYCDAIGGYCVAEPPSYCESDLDCREGEHCELICPPSPDGVSCDAVGGYCAADSRTCWSADGAEYQPGESFGGCGECTCTDSGEIICLMIYCPEGCFSDAECGDGYTCEGEQVCPEGAACFAADTPGRCAPKSCSFDTDCPDGFHCEGSSVCPPDATCVWEGEPGSCVADAPASCYSSSDCGPGQHCSTEDGDCGSACDPNSDMACLMACVGECIDDAVDCTAVLCAMVECHEGETPAPPEPGQCCSTSCAPAESAPH